MRQLIYAFLRATASFFLHLIPVFFTFLYFGVHFYTLSVSLLPSPSITVIRVGPRDALVSAPVFKQGSSCSGHEHWRVIQTARLVSATNSHSMGFLLYTASWSVVIVQNCCANSAKVRRSLIKSSYLLV